MTNPLPPFTYIANSEQFRWLAVELAKEPLLAIDTESNSMYAYQGEICLIQLSTRERDFIIDVLTIGDLSPLGILLEDKRIEKVLHAAEFDLMLFKRDYGFGIANLFDTMVAARVAGYKHHGLANMLKHYFDVDVDKRHQRDNWGERPLPNDSLTYAQMDTHYLPRLRDLLEGELRDIGRWAEAQELFEEAEVVPAAEPAYDPEGFWKLGQAKRLKRHEMAILRELYLWRERVAQGRDVPVFKVLLNDVIVNIARAAPHNMNQLNRVRGMPPAQVRRHGDEILAAVRRGRGANLPPPPPSPLPPPREILDCYNALQAWRKETGKARGVESDVVLTKALMWRLARAVPATTEALGQIQGLGAQRIALYGDSLLEVLAGCDETDETVEVEERDKAEDED